MKVSVYCLVYNHEKYLRDALNGFVNQDVNFEFEVFVHDDASTDNSVQIIKEYEKKYPHIIKPIYQKENKYSKGIKIFDKYIYPKMQGEYIAVCEGDDYWCDIHKLQKQVDFLDSHKNYIACVHNTKLIDLYKNGIEIIKYDNDAERDITFENALEGVKGSYHISSLMYRYEYGRKTPKFFDMINVGDYPMGIYLTMSGKVRYLNEVMSVYRYGTDGSWTSRTGISTLNEKINEKKQLINFYEEIKIYTNEENCRKLDVQILDQKIDILTIKGDFKKIKTAPYKDVFNGKSKKMKLKIFIKCVFHNSYMKYHNRRSK
ncbi:Glycosyl transferase family 2 [Granulicatella balaenopterae]|uniref:Glycosyl transferase family 2 n=1 Tax=Granulicatella balaenopterae TaxID=137733 RepID=A0A1H9K8X1_9LACT|nr:glycosyltransferase [Granulicatella balaenopterae]SEQ95656.1 Glycosyl transferase family 2 [Granulicatella balaenopterae]